MKLTFNDFSSLLISTRIHCLNPLPILQFHTILSGSEYILGKSLVKIIFPKCEVNTSESLELVSVVKLRMTYSPKAFNILISKWSCQYFAKALLVIIS